MNPTSTRVVTLLRRPERGADPVPEDFAVEERPLPPLASGQLLVRNIAMSVDPSMRGRLDLGEKHYTTNFQIGEPLDGSAIGVVLAVPGIPADVAELLTRVQHELFDLGGELCIPGHRAIEDSHVQALEQALDAFNDRLPPLKEFILPGGGPAAAACHLARAVCRRAERRSWTLARAETVAPEPLRYLNRLSDLLFVLARVLARHERGGEVLWKHQRRGPATEP